MGSRLDVVLEHPGKLNLYGDRDRRLIEKMGEDDLAVMRIAARSSPPKDRVMAVVVLARLRDPAAGDLLADLLADETCWSELFDLHHLRDAFADYAGIVTPWVLDRLAEPEQTPLRAGAALLARNLRIEAAGPRLLEMAQTGIAAACATGEHDWHPQNHLDYAAEVWPAKEVADEVRRWLDPPPEQAPMFREFGYRPSEAIAALAARGEPGVYEWALRLCAESRSDVAMDALVARGAESIPLLEAAIGVPDRDVDTWLRTLARISPAHAERIVRADPHRSPGAAIDILGEIHTGTENAETLALVCRIAESSELSRDVELTKAAALIGGPDAVVIAARAFARLGDGNTWRQEREDALRHVLAVAPDKTFARKVERLGPTRKQSNMAVAELAALPERPTPHTIMAMVLCHAELLVIVGADTRWDGEWAKHFRHLTGWSWPVPAGDDYRTVCEVAESLRPSGTDQRRFVRIAAVDGEHWYALVVPSDLEAFCADHDIRLPS
jgi:hypothetical protein